MFWVVQTDKLYAQVNVLTCKQTPTTAVNVASNVLLGKVVTSVCVCLPVLVGKLDVRALVLICRVPPITAVNVVPNVRLDRYVVVVYVDAQVVKPYVQANAKTYK